MSIDLFDYDPVHELEHWKDEASETLDWLVQKVEELEERLSALQGQPPAGNAKLERDAWIYAQLCASDQRPLKLILKDLTETQCPAHG